MLFQYGTKEHDVMGIFLISIAHASSHFYHLVVPSLFPWLMPAFGLNFVQAGALMTTFFVISALGQSASGFLVDRYGPKVGLYLGLSLLAASAFVLGFSQNIVMLFCASALAGAGNSVFHPTDYSLMNYNIENKRLGHAFAWHNITGNIGWAICPLFMVTLAEHYGWRLAAFSASSVAITVLIIELLFAKVFSRDQRGDTTSVKSEKEKSSFGFLSEPSVWFCFFFFFFTSGAFGVLQSFSQTIFKHAYGLDITGASAALTGYLLGCGFGSFCGGFLTNQKKLSSDKVVGISLAFAAAMSILLASQLLTGYWAVVLMSLMGYGVGIANPSRDLMIREATIKKLSMRSIGRVYGFTYCGMDCGQSLSPVVFGPILDAGLFSFALFGVAILQTCAIFTALQVGGSNRKAQMARQVQA